MPKTTLIIKDFKKLSVVKRIQELEKRGWECIKPITITQPNNQGVALYFCVMEKENESQRVVERQNKKQECEEFGFYLKNHRTEAGLTIKEVCQRMNKAPSTYLAYETGKRKPKDKDEFIKLFKKALKEDL